MSLGKPRNFFSLSDNNYIKLICRQWPVILMFFVCLDTHKIPRTLTFKEKDNPLIKKRFCEAWRLLSIKDS